MTSRITPRVEHLFRRLLPTRSANTVAVEEAQADPRPAPEPTFRVSFSLDGVAHHLRVAWAGAGWPQDIRRVLAITPDVDVVAARELSPGATALLSEHGVGYADETGRAEIVGTGLLLSRDSTAPAARPESPSSTASWPTSVLSVAEALLTGTRPTVDAIRETTGYSTGAVVKALNTLEAEKLLVRRHATRGPRSARQVTDVGRLLDAYAAASAPHRAKLPVLRLARIWHDPVDALSREIGPALDRDGTSWATTGAAAAALIAPYLTDFGVVELYVTDDAFADADGLAEILDARPAQRGHRIEIRPFPTPTARETTRAQGVRIAPGPRVYADLRAQDGRHAEAAEHLREVTRLDHPAA